MGGRVTIDQIAPCSMIAVRMSLSSLSSDTPQLRGELRMTWVGNFYRSAIGKKAVMAVTGLILFGWIFLHMLGNLKLYMGPEHLNEYAHFLRTMGAPAVPEPACSGSRASYCWLPSSFTSTRRMPSRG